MVLKSTKESKEKLDIAVWREGKQDLPSSARGRDTGLRAFFVVQWKAADAVSLDPMGVAAIRDVAFGTKKWTTPYKTNRVHLQ